MPGMLAVAYAAQQAARAYSQVRPDDSMPQDCVCQCHTQFLPSSERRGVPKAVAQRLCQGCFDEFYADWTTVIDELVG